MAGEEGEVRRHLSHALVHVEGAVPGLVHVHLVRVATLGQLLDVAHRLPVRAAAVVAPDQEHDGGAHVVREVDRVAVAHELREVLRLVTAEERAVVRLEEGRQLLVPVLVVPDGHARDPAQPQVGMLPQLEERDVPAPGVAGDHRALGVGQAVRDEILEPGVHVLELRPADVPDERVAPLPSVADRAAVVDHPDDEARVHVGLHLGLPAVEVEPRRPAVDEHHHRERAPGVVRRHVEAVHALAVRILEVPRLVRPGRRRSLALHGDRLGADVVQHEPLAVTLLVEEPDVAVRPDAPAPDEPGLVVERVERA